jgi:hypothetical protein
MHGLIVGSAEAYARPGGIALSSVLHAVRTTDYKSLCGAPVVFMFLESRFGGPEPGPVCNHCRILAHGYSPPGAA